MAADGGATLVVRRLTTAEDIDAAARLRYEAYITDPVQIAYGKADHKGRRILIPTDRLHPECMLMLGGFLGDELVCTAQCVIVDWAMVTDKALPPYMVEMLAPWKAALSRMEASVAKRAVVAYWGSGVVKAGCRNKLLVSEFFPQMAPFVIPFAAPRCQAFIGNALVSSLNLMFKDARWRQFAATANGCTPIVRFLSHTYHWASDEEAPKAVLKLDVDFLAHALHEACPLFFPLRPPTIASRRQWWRRTFPATLGHAAAFDNHDEMVAWLASSVHILRVTARQRTGHLAMKGRSVPVHRQMLVVLHGHVRVSPAPQLPAPVLVSTTAKCARARDGTVRHVDVHGGQVVTGGDVQLVSNGCNGDEPHALIALVPLSALSLRYYTRPAVLRANMPVLLPPLDSAKL